MEKNIIEFNNVNLKTSHGKILLENISFELREHESLTLIGPNGAGKSSLLKMIVGENFKDDGSLKILGVSLNKETSSKELIELRKQIGFIHQGLHLIGRKTALENVLLGRLAHNHSFLTLLNYFNEEDLKIAHEALAEVGMQAFADQRVDQLSGGEKQKVAIARALAQKPTLLIADEPTAALDPKAQRDIIRLLKSLVEKKHLSLIYVVHSLELVKEFSERVVLLNKGKIVFDGEKEKVRHEWEDFFR